MQRRTTLRHQPFEILVAEDSLTQAEELRYVLEAHGYLVTVTRNGAQALTVAREHKPHLIISDVVMPEMDGYQFCREVKNDANLRDVPVILVTTLSGPQDVVHGLECGADGFIRKPYDEHYLITRVEYLRANRMLRSRDQSQMGIEIYLGGKRHYITSERQQILDLLISTYDEAIRLESGLRHSYQSLSGLYRIADGLLQASSEQEVCDIVLERALELPDVQSGWIILRHGESDVRVGASTKIPLDGGKLGLAANACTCCRKLIAGDLLEGVDILPCERLSAEQPGDSSEWYHASIPLWVGDRKLGVLNLVGPERGIFRDEDLNMLHTVGNQVGIALERAYLRSNLEQMVAERTTALTAEIAERRRAEEESRRQATRAEALLRIGNRLNAVLDLNTILRTVCEETARALQVSAVSLSLYDHQREGFTYCADVGLPKAYRERIDASGRGPIGSSRHASGDVSGDVSEDVFVIPDALQLHDDPFIDLHRAYATRTLAAVSLSYAGDPLGLISLFTFGEQRVFTEDDLALLRGLANQAAQAISNARLLDAAQRRQRRLESLHMIDQAIMSEEELPAVLETVCNQVTEHLGVDAVRILHYDAQSSLLQFGASLGLPAGVARSGEATAGDTLAARVLREQRMLRIDNLAQAAGSTLTNELAAEGFVSYIGMPVTAQGQPSGILEIYHRSPLNPGGEWLSFLEALSLQTAIAIDHVALLSETRRLLQQTQADARQLAQVMETVPEGMLFVDPQCRIRLANARARSYLPQLVDDPAEPTLTRMGNRAIGDILSPAGADVAASQWQEIVGNDGKRIFELATGEVRDDGTIDGWVVVVREVTEERQRQQYLQVQERMATVGQLAAGIAHDFNNILTPILLYSDLSLNLLPPDSRVRSHLNHVREAGNRAKSLVSQILAFGRQNPQQQRASILLQPLLKEAFRLLRAVLPATIELQQDIDPDAGPVLADPTQIHQIVMNLCTNAHHAMREEGGTLTVSLHTVQIENGTATHPDLRPGEYIRLAVRDTGRGMERAVMERIFEPFYTTKAPGEGTGMGLSVVYGIVTSYGGIITVDSAPGQGSIFTIYLPQVESATTPKTSAVRAAPGGHERILLIDDEQSIVNATSAILERLGYTVSRMTNSVQALALFEQDPTQFDLVVTDLTMPGMKGTDVAAEIRRLRPGTPVLLISGMNEAPTAQAVDSLGLRAVLFKPFTADELGQAVRRAFDQAE